VEIYPQYIENTSASWRMSDVKLIIR
jgi:hypothetical protein